MNRGGPAHGSPSLFRFTSTGGSRASRTPYPRTVRMPPNEVVVSSAELEERAESDWLARYADQTFSLADAVSFQVMRERRIREALTLDGHFALAGFVMIPPL